MKLILSIIVTISALIFISIPVYAASETAQIIDTGDITEGTTESSSTHKSGREAVDEAVDGKSIMDEDWEMGESVLPKVDEDNFFEKIYGKLWGATTALQKVVCVFSVIFMLFSLVMVLVSSLGNRSKLPWYLLSLMICALVFTCAVYAPEIMAAFNSWISG